MRFFRKRVDPREQALNSRMLEVEALSPFHLKRSFEEVHEYFHGYVIEKIPYLSTQGPFPGICFICQKEVLFEIERASDGSPVNWRESMKCPDCEMINRWRSCIHLFHEFYRPDTDSGIYLTEALTPIASYLRSRFPNITTSEYIEGAHPGKSVFRRGRRIRNEDVTQLSFASGSLDCILSFDVLEHVPDYKSALGEFSRVLKNGGKLILTVPFNFERDTLVRAVLEADGSVTHLAEPCYHGDPLSKEGVLAYYDFGASLMDDMRAAGFSDVGLACFCSNLWGYPGANVAFIAEK
jgi:SAM-dependent methyltransferase